MTYTTSHPTSVDGVRLDTLAWGIETQTYTVGGLRSGDLLMPGLDGAVPSLYDAREPAYMALGMFVRGTDADGTVPANTDAIRLLRQNLDTLLALFGQTHKLLDVRETLDPKAPGTTGQRQAMAKVTDSISPEIEPGQVARLTVNMLIPSGYWRDVATTDWTQVAAVPGTTYTVATLSRATAPMVDAEFLVTGPLNDPAIVDVATGHRVRLPGPLAAGQSWRVNSATWESRVGTLALGSADTAGTSRAATTETVGVTPYLMPLRPAFVSGIPQVRVKLEGTGHTTATTLKVRARRAYL